SVDELQQLNGELDVPQPARAQLELTIGVRRAHLPDDPPPHGTDIVDEVLSPGGAPHQGIDGGHVRLAQLPVSRQRARLEQRLELPRLRPALVVREVTGQGPY